MPSEKEKELFVGLISCVISSVGIYDMISLPFSLIRLISIIPFLGMFIFGALIFISALRK